MAQTFLSVPLRSAPPAALLLDESEVVADAGQRLEVLFDLQPVEVRQQALMGPEQEIVFPNYHQVPA